MTALIAVVGAFAAALEAGNPIGAAQRIKRRRPTGQELVGVALMPHIKDDLILRAVKGSVQRHRQFHQSQIRGKVPAGVRHIFYNKFTQLPA